MSADPTRLWEDIHRQLANLEADPPSRNAARMWSDGLAFNLTRARYISGEVRRRIESVAHRRALRIPIPAPEVGTTYLLLFDPESHRARVAGLSVVRRADPGVGGHGLSWAALAAARRAFEGLCFSVATKGRSLSQVFSLGHHLEAHGVENVEGVSLGIATCMAMLSLHLEKPLDGTVAASGEVTLDGTLQPVAGFPQKLWALQRDEPQVTTLVVHEDQHGIPDSTPGIRIVRCARLLEVVAVFGLDDWKDLPKADEAGLRRLLDDLGHLAAPDNDPQRWAAYSASAATVASGFMARDDEVRAVKALSWAALFALHAGEVGQAHEYAREIHERYAKNNPELLQRELAGESRIWIRIVQQSVYIDLEQFDEALGLGPQTIQEAEALAPEHREGLLGRAQGTHGRALMHAGRPHDALPFLRGAYEHHLAEDRSEASRSLNYVVTCLRLCSDLAGALASCDAVQTLIDDNPGPTSATSALFVALERARCHLALGRADNDQDQSAKWCHLETARDIFETLTGAQANDASSPRISALRGLAEALRRLGDPRWEQIAARCFAVAEDERSPPRLRQVAGYAAADILLEVTAGDPWHERSQELWRRLKGGANVAEVVRRAVY